MLFSGRLHRQLILFTAITLMISSALISYFLVKESNAEILILKNEVQAKQSLIRDVWNNTIRKNNKVDVALLASLLGDKNNNDLAKIRDYYLSSLSDLAKNADITEILKAAEQQQNTAIEFINDLYIEQTGIQNKVSKLERESKLYSDIAFFLQILSLILIVLNRDIPS